MADRFIERLRSTEAIFGPEIEVLPLDELHAVVRRAEAMLAVRAPSLSPERRSRGELPSKTDPHAVIKTVLAQIDSG